MGKTTLAARVVHLHPADLVLIYDWQEGEFARRLGAPLCTTREEVAHRIEQGHRVVCYDPQIPFEDEIEERQQEDFAWWCKMVMEVAAHFPGIILAVIDENHDLMTAHKMPAAERWLLSKGRRRRIDTLLVAAAANAIHNSGRNQISELYCLGCVEKNALDFPASLGLDPDEIKALPPTHFIHWDRRSRKITKLDLWGEKSNAGNSD